MGKNQHSKDLLHQRPTEWAQDGRGFKAQKWTPFSQLALDCCFLSLQPFETPVGTADGQVFEVKNILKYIKKYKVNPVTGGRLEAKELVPLNFHRNGEDKIHCPVTMKVFTNHSHVVLNIKSGHIFSYEAVQELNFKNKMFNDLITNEPFKKTDILTLQDPHDPNARHVSKFFFMKEGQQEAVTLMLNPAMADNEENSQRINMNSSMQRIFDEKHRLGEVKALEQQALEDAKANAPEPEVVEKKKNWYEEYQRLGKQNERYTSGEMAEAFTSSTKSLTTQNELRKQTDVEELEDIYKLVRTNKAKGYVRIITSEGMLNLELHCNIVPRTTDNFIRLCEKNYYDNSIFHRLIKNFMMQGGDPTNTGKGGESAFEKKSFRDEFDSRLEHKGPGIVSMANNGTNTNRSQFFVTLKSCPHLDNKHSIFGRVVGGLELVHAFNEWPVDDPGCKTSSAGDRPSKEIKVLRTEVFKNPFAEAAAEMAKPKVEEKPLNPEALWFSNRRDPMEKHTNRASTSVGKYLDAGSSGGGSSRRKAEDAAAGLTAEELEYGTVAQKVKKMRTSFDFSKF